MNVEDPKLVQAVQELVLEGFEPHFGELAERFESHPTWARATKLGSLLWLDTGDVDAIESLWTRELTALTTNNTLLNKEVQKGTYDALVPRAAEVVRSAVRDVSDADLVREIAFVLNAAHALRLVQTFDAMVSVEEHTDLAHDVAAAVGYARRYHAICPERFYVKLPLTPEGLIAARQVGSEGIPVNLTLGFSARQNILVALYARPAFCNVFLGRLNQVVSENGFGDGGLVGERATLASQKWMLRLSESDKVPTRQIAASLRSGEQVRALLGVDVLTMPPKAASGFLNFDLEPDELQGGVDAELEPEWADGVDPEALGLNLLWHAPYGVENALREVASGRHDTGEELVRHLIDVGFVGALPAWSDEDVARADADGKIPRFGAWADRIASGEIGLDAVMNLSGLRSFVADQAAMDDRIRGLL
jgi:transaldolase